MGGGANRSNGSWYTLYKQTLLVIQIAVAAVTVTIAGSGWFGSVLDSQQLGRAQNDDTRALVHNPKACTAACTADERGCNRENVGVT